MGEQACEHGVFGPHDNWVPIEGHPVGGEFCPCVGSWETTTRWCLVHDQPAGPQAYAYCWDIDAANLSNQDHIDRMKEREGCDIRDVLITLGQPTLAD